MNFRRLHSLAFLVLLSLIGEGCKREDIQVYQAPKDLPPPSTQSVSQSPASAGPARATSPEPQSPPWVTPDGWMAVPSSGGMRIASYAIQGSDGRTASVSVVPLGPEASGELDNVNRWRRELQLAPITAAEVDASRQTTKIGSLDAKLYELASDLPILDAKFKSRTMAAMLPLDQATIFFKMMGEDALVAENKPKFLAWLKSVQVGGGEPTGTAPSASAAPTGGPSMSGPVAPPPATGLPNWTVPEGWQAVAGSGMRLASFVVPGEGGAKGDLSVVALGPQAGGVVANVTRWRNQLGLPPLGETEMSTSLKSVTTRAGDKAILVELEGVGASSGTNLLGAIVTRPDRTWFYKLTGPKILLNTERTHFQEFVQSVSYP